MTEVAAPQASGALRLGAARPGPELAIVVPAFNESANIRPLLEAVAPVLEGLVEWEMVVVDDNSPDRTAAIVRDVARTDARIRCVQRVGRRGLSSAVIEGILATTAPLIIVMDADLQHDERLLPQMLRELRGGAVDVVIGSRYVEGGGMGTLDAERARSSRLATTVAHLVVRVAVKDLMSGYFAITRTTFESALPRLSAIGFKILLDVLASTPQAPRVKELPYNFRARQHGESKLDSMVIWEYGMLLLDKKVGRWVPVRFISFATIGVIGIVLHLLIVTVMFSSLHMPFLAAQITATIAALTSNFLLNNALTYRDRRLSGLGLVRGWFVFAAICSLGAVANIGLAGFMFGAHSPWLVASLAGVIVGSIWNYVMTSILAWRVPMTKA